VSLINEAQPNNYAAGLEQKTAFVRYQRDAQNPLQSSAIRDGNITTNLALQNFRSLATEASNTKDTAVNYAARDLCLKRGIMDEYDFCSDLTNATPSPFSLDCLQKEFRKQGGQPAGSEYPRTANLAKWNSFQNWGAVKNAIQQLAQRVRATNSEIQRKALQEFMGITREMPPRDQIPSIAGMDVFWINSGTNTFLGRRTTVGNAKLPDFVSDGEVASTGLSEYVQYVVLTNLRPPQDLSIQLRTETDDGTVWVLNKDLNPPAYRNISVDTSDTFGRYWDQPPTTHTLSACWNLRRGGANYLLGTWQETGGRAHTKTLYSVCGKNNFTEIPSNWFTLTQEPDAPMLAWEGMLQTETDAVSFRETRLPSIFNMNYTGSYFIKKSSEFPNIPCILNLVNAGFATTTMSYSMQSWRTLTIALSIQMVTRVTRLFTFGNFFCDIIPNGSTCVVSFGWDSATLVTSSTGGLSIQGVPFNKPILLFANIRPDYEGTYPNRLTVAAATLEEWANGNVSISGNSQRTKSVTTSQNNPLYNKSDAAQIRFGHPEWNSGCSFNIGWLHVFDYELNATDVARDATNAWVRVPWAA
jgi:hypothetical protein